jgi:outer membrane protein assembly factor BamB
VIDAQTLLYASMDHFLYAIDLISSPTELELDKDGSRTLRTDYLWKTDLGMAVIADPVIEDGIVYVATIEGKLFAVEANSGEIVWSFDNGGDLGAIWGSPVIDDSVIFFADINGDVYTVEKGTGKQFWPSPFNAGGGIVGGGVRTNDGIVFATDEGKLFIINQEKEPKTLASFENAIYSPLSIYGENVLVAPASEEGLLSAYDLEGFEEWSFVPAE